MKGSSLNWVGGDLGEKVGALLMKTSTQVLNRQPSCPNPDNQISETLGFSQAPSKWDLAEIFLRQFPWLHLAQDSLLTLS